ncbi:hypothetical protein QWZ16_23820 [Vibrio ostreicida]|uniref:Uncharacterized protein n=1 Tax=Vibrio ostreicida TaxID=526588 RepID=A0ABT8BZN7_9VIBR|nr:hypothetical protein [Vibrio ostreicida]MDN3612626.1 hypothetical protein [Vibrio ostreicida]
MNQTSMASIQGTPIIYQTSSLIMALIDIRHSMTFGEHLTLCLVNPL